MAVLPFFQDSSHVPVDDALDGHGTFPFQAHNLGVFGDVTGHIFPVGRYFAFVLLDFKD